jgi:glycosyltransferase involved in cell wall biosynthesis
MSDCRISIALCTYNGAKYLAEQLHSYARQIRPPDEVVICDDGSTDATSEIVKQFSKTAPFPIKWHENERNLGTTKNFERAIRLCSGDIIFLSDQDDVWRDDKIALMVAKFAARPEAGAVFSDADVVDHTLKSLGYRMWRSAGFDRAQQRQMDAEGGSLKVLLKHNVVTGAAMAFRSKFVPQICPIPEGWIHDGWIALLIAGLSNLQPVREPLVQYRQHASNQIGGVRRTQLDRVESARSDGRALATAKYRLVAEQYRAARERLRPHTGGQHWKNLETPLSEKIRHIENRIWLREHQKVKLWYAFVELLSQRYFRYSAGWGSFLKDAF